MDKAELRKLLSALSVPGRSPDCPSDETLASYVEGGMIETDHSTFEDHLANCDWCIDCVGILGRAWEAELIPRVPELTLAEAKRLAAGGSRIVRWHSRAGSWAVAALLVLAVGVFVHLQPPAVPGETPNTKNDEVRITRTIDPDAMTRIQVADQDGSFSWSPVSDTLFYQVRVVSADGDLLWQERTNDTDWRIPEGLGLGHGIEYFLRIDAFVSETRSINSDYVLFRLDD